MLSIPAVKLHKCDIFHKVGGGGIPIYLFIHLSNYKNLWF